MDDVLYTRELPGGRLLFLVALTFGRARLHVGPRDAPVYDDAW